MRRRAPLSVLEDKFGSQQIIEADVISIHPETRRATVRPQGGSQNMTISLGSIDPVELIQSRGRLLIYTSPLGGTFAMAILAANSSHAYRPGVTLGDSQGGCKWCIYNSNGLPVACIDSQGNLVFTGGTYYAYDVPLNPTYWGSYQGYPGIPWLTSGNVATSYGTHFLGTFDDEPFEIRAANLAAMRFYPTYPDQNPNIVGGSGGNYINESAIGQTISGGGKSSAPNYTSANFATIGGGSGNAAIAHNTVIGGGRLNTVANKYNVVGGGRNNYNLGGSSRGGSTIAGGRDNTIQSGNANTIGGGMGNEIGNITWAASYNTIGGGYYNVIGDLSGKATIHSAICGGRENLVRPDWSFIGGGYHNEIDHTGSLYSTLCGGSFNTIENFEVAEYGGGLGHFIGGGGVNTVAGYYSTICGGYYNNVTSTGAYYNGCSGIVAGYGNTISGVNNYGCNFIGGGFYNSITATGDHATDTIGGGYQNTISGAGKHHTIGGGRENTITVIGDASVISGGYYNQITGNNANYDWNSIGGGWYNRIQDSKTSTIAGGNSNLINGGYHQTIGGGIGNQAYSYASTVCGGNQNYINDADSTYSVIGGGSGNNIFRSQYSVIGGGSSNLIGSSAAISYYNTIGGGAANEIVVSTRYATIPGGWRAVADKYGQIAAASGRFGADGDAQGTIQAVLRRQVEHSDANYYPLYPDGSGTFKWTIGTYSAWTFNAKVIGATQYCSYNWGYELAGVIANRGGTVQILSSTVTDLYEDISTFACRVVADDVNDALQIEVRDAGSYGLTVRWVATLRTAEVSWA